MHRTYVDLPHSPHTMVTNKVRRCTPVYSLVQSAGYAYPRPSKNTALSELHRPLIRQAPGGTGTVAESLPAKRSSMLTGKTGS